MIEVLEGGIQTTIQDFPGRQGLLDQGICPAGPFDNLAFRLANLLVGNEPGNRRAGDHRRQFPGSIRRGRGDRAHRRKHAAEARRRADRALAVVSRHARPDARPGQCRRPGVSLLPGGERRYRRSALPWQPRHLCPGRDRWLRRARAEEGGSAPGRRLGRQSRRRRRTEGEGPVVPSYTAEWELEAVPGPQAAPDYWTWDDYDHFFSHNWKLDRNSNRMGYRLEPHSWQWARTTGGVAGGHPSNILDNGYAVGAVNISGDQPIILCVDGPTLGGFVCAAGRCLWLDVEAGADGAGPRPHPVQRAIDRRSGRSGPRDRCPDRRSESGAGLRCHARST